MEQIKQLIVLIEQKNDEKLSSVLKDLKSIKDNNSLVDTDILKTLNEILNVSKTINKDDIEEIRNEVKTISESINKKQDNPLMEDLITAIKNIKIEQPSEISIKGMGKLKGATGEKGDKGDNGYTPIKGVDYFDGEKGEKGKDGSPDTPEQIVEKINTLENVIDIKTIKDFPVIEGTADIKRQMDTIGNQVLRLLSRPKTTGGGGGTWGSILGTLSNQTDLQNALNLKYDASNPAGYITSSALSGYTPTSRTITINGTTQDLSSNRSWTIAVPTKTSDLTNDSGFITSSALTGYLQNNIGISGGTTLIGGTASGDNLTLSSTSNATKGKILFGTSAYDEVNNRLGIGTTTPVTQFQVTGSVNTSYVEVSSGVGIQSNSSGSGLITAMAFTPADPVIGISNGANFGFNGSGNNFYGIGLAALRNSAYDMWFQTGNVNGGGYRWYTGTTERMTMDKNGKVGIGTNSPSVGDFGSTFTVKGTGSEIGIITAQRNVSTVANGTGFQTVLNNASSNPVTYSYFNGYIITNTAGAESGGLMFFTRNAGTLGSRMTILNDGNTGIGTTSPTAYLHLKAGTATASTAPLKFTSGTLNTTAEAGVMEYNNTPHFTNSDATRRHIVLAPNTTKVTASAPYTNDGYIIINIGGTDFKVMTTA